MAVRDSPGGSAGLGFEEDSAETRRLLSTLALNKNTRDNRRGFLTVLEAGKSKHWQIRHLHSWFIDSSLDSSLDSWLSSHYVLP